MAATKAAAKATPTPKPTPTKSTTTFARDHHTGQMYSGTVTPEVVEACKKSEDGTVLAKSISLTDDFGQAKGSAWILVTDEDLPPGKVVPGEFRVIKLHTLED